MKLEVININQIERGERAREDYGDLNTLIEDIKLHGLIQPLAVAAQTGEKPYKLLAGGRRLAACIRAEIEEVPVRVYDESLTELQMKSIELSENLCRLDLSWPEEIKLKKEINTIYKEIHGEKVSTLPGAEGHSNADTARMLGESSMNLSRDLKLAGLVETMPALGNLKTKSEALKVLQAIGTGAIREQKAKKIEKLRSLTPTDDLRRVLADTFKGGNGREIADLPDNTYKIIDLDPPYAIDLDKQNKHAGVDITMTNYDEMNAEEYSEIMKFLLPHCHRILKPDGWLILWFGPTLWWTFNEEEPRKSRFMLRALPNLWTKGTGQTNQPKIHLPSTYEMFFTPRKEASRIIRQGRSNEFSFKPVAPQRKTCKAEKPVELMQEILSVYCEPGDKIAVPFGGSGNTLLAGSNLGLDGIAFDLAQANKNAFVVKVYDAEPGSYRSYREV